jgi:hypothetical protein
MQDFLIHCALCWFAMIGFPASPIDLAYCVRGVVSGVLFSAKQSFGFSHSRWPR